MYSLLKRQLQRELAELKNTLTEHRGHISGQRRLQRREWILRGVLEHDFNLSLLEDIIYKYEKIDAVPTGYH